MSRSRSRVLLAAFFAFVVGCAVMRLGLPLSEVPRIEKEQLRTLLGSPEVTILDLRSPNDWYGSTEKIKGAVREDPREIETWASKYPKDRRLVLYCA